jgi:hypothetical protein
MMNRPDDWTDEMIVALRPGRTENELVALVMDALIERRNLASVIPIMHDDFGLTDDDIGLAFDRIQGGIVRAITGNPENEPDKKKDPLAWHAFKIVWKDLPRRSPFSSRKKTIGSMVRVVRRNKKGNQQQPITS